MAMVFSKQRFENNNRKVKNIYSKNPNTLKSTSFRLNVLKIRCKEKNTVLVNKIEENKPEKLNKLLITDYAEVKNKEQKRWRPHASHDSYTFQAFK